MAIGDTGTFVDPADGQTYKWKVMQDGKKWLVENYRLKTPKAKVYKDNEANVAQYGRLYNWNELNTVIPSGWKLPSQDEWYALVWAYDSDDWKALKALYSTGYAGFNLELAGAWSNEYKFYGLGEVTQFATSTKSGWSQSGGDQHAICCITNCVSILAVDGEGDKGHWVSCRFMAAE